MNIVHLATYDASGGAARSAYRLHQGLRAIGESSSMLVMRKTSNDANVVEFDPSLSLPGRVRRFLRGYSIRSSQSALENRPTGASYFSDDRSPYGAGVLKQLPPAEILNLHWIAGLLDYQNFFPNIPKRIPVVWTLHDMNPFTGGCHFDADCGRFVAACGECPQLGSRFKGDFSEKSWQRKRQAFLGLGTQQLNIVTPSRWLAGEVAKGSLLRKFPVSVIPYGVDTELFKPRDRESSRTRFGVPLDANVVLFVADWAGEKRKGMEILLSAMEQLAGVPKLHFVAAGRGVRDVPGSARFTIVDHIADDELMSHLYSCADLFVIPSLQDNFPNTALEAISCGTPVLGFDVGGLPDFIKEGESGRLIPRGNATALGNAISAMLDDHGLLSSLREHSRTLAVKEYALKIQASKYLALYTELVRRIRMDQ